MNKKVLKWNFVFQYGYVLTNIFNSIILLPLYVKHIDSATLGIWLATGNILAWITLTDPGVGDVLQQKIAELKGKNLNKEVGQTIGAGFFASSIILVVSILVGFVFYFLLGTIINKDVSIYPHLQTALMLSIIAIGMSLVSFSMSGINQGLQNSADVAIATVLANVLFLVTNLFLLYKGFGVISIAFSNLARSVFINIYNITSMMKVLKKENLKMEFDWPYFKKFIKIFSFTSISRIITGLSGSVDMIILARFIPPSMITVYEINKRPINMTSGLIGRHSVALMPLISHGKGKGDEESIVKFISSQFRIYSYAALFTSFMFWLTYRNLITLWTGKAQYAGDTIMHLLVANFFIGLIGYFMSNMGYALGDIKMNSLINMVKGVVLAILLFLVANKYGIVGTLVVAISVSLVSDFFYFSYRLYKLGYLKTALLKSIISSWILIVPLSLLAGWGCKMLVEHLFSDQVYLPKLLVAGSLFTIFFMLVVLLFDTEIRNTVKDLKDKFLASAFFYKLKRA
jgi:O-antigen/teichoic acid export membrane protein